jgi:hypothetical protein
MLPYHRIEELPHRPAQIISVRPLFALCDRAGMVTAAHGEPSGEKVQGRTCAESPPENLASHEEDGFATAAMWRKRELKVRASWSFESEDGRQSSLRITTGCCCCCGQIHQAVPSSSAVPELGETTLGLDDLWNGTLLSSSAFSFIGFHSSASSHGAASRGELGIASRVLEM